ncbi:hypothetical protein ACOI22_11830 [Glaciecola sp. 2405UD65-10]|uniref:hypothetical protein n=1 Tax=Glaciecola sp. 2405UD65-10 TaxID=3397244 RepID=UPI003B5CE09A
MKIGQTYKEPSVDTQKFFDGMENENPIFSFICGACQRRIRLDFWKFLDEASNWENNFCDSDLLEIKSKISFPQVSEFIKSHEGGQPYLAITVCEYCAHKHLVYVGFYEFQPARYFGTLQGVYEAIT